MLHRDEWQLGGTRSKASEAATLEQRGEIYEGVSYAKGICPVAEKLQRNIIQFKTSMRDVTEIKTETDALRKAIQAVQARG